MPNIYHISGDLERESFALAELLSSIEPGDTIYCGPGTYTTYPSNKANTSYFLSCSNINIISENGYKETFFRPNSYMSYMSNMKFIGFTFIRANGVSYRFGNNWYIERSVLSNINNTNGIFYSGRNISCVASLITDCQQPTYSLTQYALFYNCTFINNVWRSNLELDRNGGGIYNCIVDDIPDGWKLLKTEAYSFGVHNSYFGYTPDFVDKENGNYELKHTSICKYMGSGNYLKGSCLDLYGRPFDYDHPSAGCLQYQKGNQNWLPNKMCPLKYY